MRKDLEELNERKAFLYDENRPTAVEKRHAKGYRTARENITDLVDADSFVESASLIVAGQSRRRSKEDLIANTPADGLIGGIATVNGNLLSSGTETMVISYDYTVLAGTQGAFNHKKTYRLIQQARKLKLPIVLFLDGGGGRP